MSLTGHGLILASVSTRHRTLRLVTVDRKPAETVIVGGGIHGVSVALALAARGRRSLILEAAGGLLEGASVSNEGKVHLGFVYGLDQSGKTTRAMVEGALSFAPLVDRWCGGIDWSAGRSGSFGYVVMEEGLAGPGDLENHYDSVLAEIGRAGTSLGSNYLGVDMKDATVTRREGTFPGMKAGLSELLVRNTGDGDSIRGRFASVWPRRWPASR